jgi:arylsulfatase A-like enzyme/Flp pilus assembly protein TadD
LKKVHPIRFLLFACVFLSLFLSTNLANSKMKKENRLNVLLITIDTLRADRLSCYSDEHLNTPNIDSLAERGILFTKAFAHTSTTLPSHTNILFGTTPLHHGVHDNSNFIIREEFLSAAEHLKKYDYATAAFIGAFPLDSRFGISQGFDLYDDDYDVRSSKTDLGKERKADIVVDRAISWLKEQNSLWFLWIHCWDPHDPYKPPEPFKTRFSKNPYDGEVAYVDHVLGRLFSYMEENNLFDNSLIIFTGDHGESLGEHEEETHGLFAYNSTIWIPLIISVPDLKPRKDKQHVSHIDIFPTICEVLDIEKPAFLHGTSLLPALKGKKLKRRAIYFESLYPYYSRGWAPLRGYVYDNEKFIDSPIPELYNIEEDFDELENLASKKDLSRYRKKLDQIISSLFVDESSQARQKLDRKSLEKLRSLGYISGSSAPAEESFGPDQDVKVLIPYHTKSTKAMNLYRGGKAMEAIKLLKEVITERDDVGIAYENLAKIYEDQGRLRDAIEVLRLGLDAVPSYYEILYTYVTFLLTAEQYDEVIRVVNARSSLRMDIDPEIWNFLGLAYWNNGNLEDAQKAYEKSISLDNEYPISYNNLGSLYFSIFKETKDVKFYQKALEKYNKAVELDPFYHTAYYGLGIAYLQMDNSEMSINSFKKALELRPDNEQAMYYLGIAYMRKGDKVNALKYFNMYKASPSYQLLSPEEKAKLEKWIQENTPVQK